MLGWGKVRCGAGKARQGQAWLGVVRKGMDTSRSIGLLVLLKQKINE